MAAPTATATRVALAEFAWARIVGRKGPGTKGHVLRRGRGSVGEDGGEETTDMVTGDGFPLRRPVWSTKKPVDPDRQHRGRCRELDARRTPPWTPQKASCSSPSPEMAHLRSLVLWCGIVGRGEKLRERAWFSAVVSASFEEGGYVLKP